MVGDDEYLERLVAGIHARTTSGATVVWNDRLNGRQFDVSVRFANGTLTYLVLAEVKNRTRKASAEDVEAFVTKSRDQGANKSVFVTAAGFQSGAIEVAKRHGVDLFRVGFDHTNPALGAAGGTIVVQQSKEASGHTPFLALGPEILGARIDEIMIFYADDTSAEVPAEQTQMRYYLKMTSLSDGRTFDQIIEENPIYEIALGQRRRTCAKIEPRLHMEPPDDIFLKPDLSEP